MLYARTYDMQVKTYDVVYDENIRCRTSDLRYRMHVRHRMLRCRTCLTYDIDIRCRTYSTYDIVRVRCRTCTTYDIVCNIGITMSYDVVRLTYDIAPAGAAGAHHSLKTDAACDAHGASVLIFPRCHQAMPLILYTNGTGQISRKFGSDAQQSANSPRRNRRTERGRDGRARRGSCSSRHRRRGSGRGRFLNYGAALCSICFIRA
jgi:hypothetical protein